MFYSPHKLSIVLEFLLTIQNYSFNIHESIYTPERIVLYAFLPLEKNHHSLPEPIANIWISPPKFNTFFFSFLHLKHWDCLLALEIGLVLGLWLDLGVRVSVTLGSGSGLAFVLGLEA